MQPIIEFLLKYPATAWERGTVSLRSNILGPFLPLVLVALFLMGVASYMLVRDRSRSSRIFLGLVRGAVFSFLFFLLMRPVLVVPSVLPERSFVGVLYDISRSMTVRDGENRESRLEQVQESLQKGNQDFLTRLSARFKVRHFRFASSAVKMEMPAGLQAEGDRTNLQQALADASAELRGAPLSGLIVVSDGADNASKELRTVLGGLRSSNVPVYTVGVGTEKLQRDIELAGAFSPRKTLEGESILVDVAVRGRGYAGSSTRLIIEEYGRTLATEEVKLGGDEEIINRRLPLTPRGKGVHTYRILVQPLEGEILTENNARDILVRVSEETPSILYLEGEPRWEYKFLRRSVEGDPSLRLVSVLRTAKNQLLRQGIESKDQLLGGFPGEKHELFTFKGLILGSLEASYFTAGQLQTIEDFVSRRGGGFLMLGGRKSYAEGGYLGTALEKMLPVDFAKVEGIDDAGKTTLKPVLSDHGRLHPVTRLSPIDSENRQQWEALPAVTITNRFTGLKAGATELLRGQSEKGALSQILLAFQRYGRGRSVALGTDSTWHWRMLVSHERTPLESFWKQALRWLVSAAPDRVEASVDRDFLAVGEAVEIRAEVLDKNFLSSNRASVSATVKRPSGQETSLPLDWTIDEDGFYSAMFTASESGLHQVTVQAEEPGGETLAGRTQFVCGPSLVEFRDAVQNRQLLEDIARETGGRYFPLDQLSAVPEAVRFINNEAAVTEELDLWDLPLHFLILVALLGLEWWVRNRLKLV